MSCSRDSSQASDGYDGRVGVEDLDLVERNAVRRMRRNASRSSFSSPTARKRRARRAVSVQARGRRPRAGGDGLPRRARGRAARRRRARPRPGIRNSASLRGAAAVDAARRSTSSRPRIDPRRGARRIGPGSRGVSLGLRASAKARRGDRLRLEPRRTQLVERLLERAVEAGPISELPEVRAGRRACRRTPARRARAPGRGTGGAGRPEREPARSRRGRACGRSRRAG